MTNDQLVDFLGPVAARHDAACDRYKANPTRENEALVRLYAAELSRMFFHGDMYDLHVLFLHMALCTWEAGHAALEETRQLSEQAARIVVLEADSSAHMDRAYSAEATVAKVRELVPKLHKDSTWHGCKCVVDLEAALSSSKEP